MSLWCSVARPVCVLTLACAAMVGCGPSEDGQASSSASAQDGGSTQEPAVIRFGLVPTEGGTDTVARFTPLAEHLEASLGVPVETFSATEYVGIITAMQNKQVDVAYFGPKSYVEANRIAGAEAVAKELNADGVPGYYSILVTSVDSGIGSLSDAEGASFGFVAPNSTSGYLVPSIGLGDELGMPVEEYFGEIHYTGTHGNAVQSVLAGDLQVAVTNTLDVNAMGESGTDVSRLVELWRSDLIPSQVIAVRGDLPEAFAMKVRDAVLEFGHDADAMSEMARGGYVAAEDSEYEVIRVLEQIKAERDGG